MGSGLGGGEGGDHGVGLSGGEGALGVEEVVLAHGDVLGDDVPHGAVSGPIGDRGGVGGGK